MYKKRKQAHDGKLLFNHIGLHTHIHRIIQAGVISAKGVSTTDTGIAFRKISK